MKTKMKVGAIAVAICTPLVLSVGLAGLRTESFSKKTRQSLLKGDWTNVLKLLERSDIKDADVPCRMIAAHACLATNRNNHALVLFLSTTPEDLANWKEWTKALAESNPRIAVSHYLHADALARDGDLLAADRESSQTIERDPKLGLAWVARGAVRALQGKKDEAYVDLLKATQVQPTLADAHASLGCLEVMLQNAEGALDAFNAALRIDPNFALAYNGRGCARYGLGKPDEAFLDFEMAETLCPALVMTEANQSFVLAMVAQKVDEKVAPLQRPGTTLTTRSEASERVSFLSDPAKLQAAIDRDGPDATLRNLYQIRNDLFSQIQDIHKWTVQNQKAIEWDNGVIMATEYGKVATAALGVGSAVRNGFQAFLTHAGIAVGKEGINKGFGQLSEPAPLSARMVTASVAWDTAKGAGFDPRGFLFQSVEEMAKGMRATRLQVGTVMCRTAGTAGMMLRDVDRAIQNVQNAELAKQLRSGTEPSSPLTGLTFTSAQPWSQMPSLLDNLTGGKNLSRPALLVTQDPVKSYAFQRMLENKGIPSVMTSSMGKEQLDRLGSALRPSAVVGFRRDLDDSYRKLLPKPPDPPNKFGGAGIGPSIPITRQGDTFSFPGASGKTVTLPVPSGFNTPSGTWDSFKPWTPKGNVGGVRTKDLEWVFVDKGNWPVMTFFTLAYSPVQASTREPNNGKD